MKMLFCKAVYATFISIFAISMCYCQVDSADISSKVFNTLKQYTSQLRILRNVISVPDNVIVSDSLFQLIENVEVERDSALMELLFKYRKSISAPLIIRYLNCEFSTKDSLFKSLSERQKNTADGKLLKQELDEGRMYIGYLPPDIKLFDTNNDSVRLYDLIESKKVVLIDFWASWCYPCRKEFLTLKNLYNKTRNEKFEIVGISIDKNDSLWKAAITHDKISWINIIDSGESAYTSYNGAGIPRKILLAPDGKVVEWNCRLGSKDLKRKIHELHKKQIVN